MCFDVQAYFLGEEYARELQQSSEAKSFAKFKLNRNTDGVRWDYARSGTGEPLRLLYVTA